MAKGICKCGQDHTVPGSVFRSYISKHDGPDKVCQGHYEGEYFEPEDSPGDLGGYDLVDNSDTCSNCGRLCYPEEQPKLKPVKKHDALGLHLAIKRFGPNNPPKLIVDQRLLENDLGGGGVEILIPGFKDNPECPGEAQIFLEYYEGKVWVRIWNGDQNPVSIPIEKK